MSTRFRLNLTASFAILALAFWAALTVANGAWLVLGTAAVLAVGALFLFNRPHHRVARSSS